MKFSAAFKSYFKAYLNSVGTVACHYDLDRGIWQNGNFTLRVSNPDLIREIHKAASTAKIMAYNEGVEAVRDFVQPQVQLSAHTKDAIVAAETHTTTDTTRTSLCAVRVEPDCVVATDGHRLAVIRTNTTGLMGLLGGRNFSIDGSVVRLIESCDEVGFSVVENKLMLHVAKSDIRMDVVCIDHDRSFPKWQDVVPTSESSAIVGFGRDTTKAIRKPISDVKATGLYKNKASIIKVDDPNVTLSVSCLDAKGDPIMHSPQSYGMELVECVKPKVEIGINYTYLKEAMELVEEGSLTIRDPLDPIVVLSKDENTMILIMPMRV